MPIAQGFRWLRSSGAAAPPVFPRAPKSGIWCKDLNSALTACEALRIRRFASTLACWPRVEHNAVEIGVEYLCALEQVHRAELDCRISVKPLALAFRRDLLVKVADRAHALQVPLYFDSPPAEVADVTYTAMNEAANVHDAVGCTVVGRWRRSVTDVEWAASRGFPVRIVKGAWADPDDPNRDPRTGFLEVVNHALGHPQLVSIATHDAPLAREALARLRAAGTPCELELLAGRPAERPLQIAVQLGVPVRYYVPYGDAVLPYRISDAARRASGHLRLAKKDKLEA